MMMLSAVIPAKSLLSDSNHIIINNNTTHYPLKFLSNNCHLSFRPNNNNNASSSSLANGISQDNNNNEYNSFQNRNPNSNREILHHQVNHNDEDDDDDDLVTSASAIAAVIRKASSSSHVDFVQRIEKKETNRLGSPSSDFQRLCSEQLDLFRKIVDREAILSVYVRDAGSYVMDRLELRRVTLYPGTHVAESADVVVLIGSFGISTGLRVAEASLSNRDVEVIHECRAVVFPMVKHPFVVGFLVAEFPMMEFETCDNVGGDGKDLQLCTSPEPYPLPLHIERNRWDTKSFKEDPPKTFQRFTAEQKSSVINISRSLAMAYVMDQKAMLLQQSSWQNNIRMSELVEQIRGSLSSIRSLSKMLSIHMKRSEISYDVIEDILVQGDRMRDTLQQLQDAVYLTKANIVRYNEESLRKMKHSAYVRPETGSSQFLENILGESHTDKTKQLHQAYPLSSAAKDLEMPMPPLALAPLRQHNISQTMRCV
ncbi:hypothetical protein AQUCO_01100488v1 [Aquilegia coerulea]|uniref:Chloroplast sensor kinase, chloroplastic n=1 Tax=Aquilegia coerulea TaxID=218851 RepID=A0A2G5E7X3_AQUCA|nr:hypothetical protein AQUCO_01100488v1 [Aquilegia coerulea]